MNILMSSVAASVILFLLLGVGVITMPVNAQMPTTVSGTYVNANTGIEIVFPDGWEGMEIATGNATIVSVYPGGLGAVTGDLPTGMSVIVSTKSATPPTTSEPPNVPKDSKVVCGTAAVSNVNVAGVTALQSVVECTFDGKAMKSKTVMIDAGAKWVMASFMGATAEYDQNVGKFDSSITTLQVNGAVNSGGVPGGSIEVILTPVVKTVMIAGANVNVDLKSSSTISEFSLDESNKRLSFKVDGQTGTEGTTEITIGKVLEGPYTVTIDGAATTDFKETKTASGEAMLTISYTHSTHNVAITGTSVVPEFPIVAIGAIAAIVGLVAVLSRTKLMSGFTSRSN